MGRDVFSEDYLLVEVNTLLGKIGSVSQLRRLQVRVNVSVSVRIYGVVLREGTLPYHLHLL